MENEILGPVISRRTALRVVASAPLLLLSASCGSSQNDVTGYWILRAPRRDGTFRESFFDLKQSGETVTGNLIRGSHATPVSAGTFAGGKLHFEVPSRFRQNEVQIPYDGVMQNGRLAMTVKMPGGNTVTGVAERTTRAATLPPARLPIPALHDVPDNGLVRTPPMGWNSWNKFAGRVDEAVVRGAADAIVASGMSKAGYLYVNIDDTWQGERDKNGNIQGNSKFPDMKALADYVHSKGLKIGIYSSPGPKTCAGYEGSYGHEEQDARTYASWGFDYLKYDWCSASGIYKNDEMQPVYQKMGDALKNTSRPIVYSLCQYGDDNVWTWGAKVGGNLWRTTGDINDSWRRMSEIGFSQFDIVSYVTPGHWNDPDMLEIGNGGMTSDEYRTHMSLWCLLRAPLLAGNDLTSMSEETKSILMNHEVIAIDQDRAAKPPKVISQSGDTEVVARPLADGSTAVALFNKGDRAAEVRVDWEAAGVRTGRLRARDLWKHAEVRAGGNHYAAEVPTHGVVLLRVEAEA